MYAALRATDLGTGQVVGYRRHSQIDPKKATAYVSPTAARQGLESAEKRWPSYQWEVVDRRTGAVIPLEKMPKSRFSREEVLKLLEQERGACAYAMTTKWIIDMPASRCIVDEACGPLGERLK